MWKCGESVWHAVSQWPGLTNEDIIHVCYGYGLFTGGMGLDFGAKALGATAIPMSAGNTKRQMMVMEDLGATAFACTPSYALYLAESIQEAGLVDRMKLKAGIHGAEPWTEEMRKKIESILHINCFDIYGLCEITGPALRRIVFIRQDFTCMRITSILKYSILRLMKNVQKVRPGSLYLPLWQKRQCLCCVTAQRILRASPTVNVNVAGLCQESPSLRAGQMT